MSQIPLVKLILLKDLDRLNPLIFPFISGIFFLLLGFLFRISLIIGTFIIFFYLAYIIIRIKSDL